MKSCLLSDRSGGCPFSMASTRDGESISEPRWLALFRAGESIGFFFSETDISCLGSGVSILFDDEREDEPSSLGIWWATRL